MPRKGSGKVRIKRVSNSLKARGQLVSIGQRVELARHRMEQTPMRTKPVGLGGL